MKITERHIRRLRIIVTALRDAAKVEELVTAFSMSRYGWKTTGKGRCGTPACSLGHFAARRDLQSFLRLDKYGDMLFVKPSVRSSFTRQDADFTYPRLQNYFGITPAEAENLFSDYGCNEATTPEAAAEYIEIFCGRKERGLKCLANT